jgi:hypothetical protein
MLADHFGTPTKLFVAGAAEGALSAGDEVMDADPSTDFEILDLSTGFLHHASDFMPEGERQGYYRRNSPAVMRIGMANTSGANADKNVAGANRRNVNFLVFQRRTDCGETNSFHSVNAS